MIRGKFQQLFNFIPHLVPADNRIDEAMFKLKFGALKSIGQILADLGTDYNAVAKFTTYLVDSSHIEPFMALRQELFPTLFAGPLYPPNTLLIVDRLVKPEFLIEVEAVARLPG